MQACSLRARNVLRLEPFLPQTAMSRLAPASLQDHSARRQSNPNASIIERPVYYRVIAGMVRISPKGLHTCVATTHNSHGLKIFAPFLFPASTSCVRRSAANIEDEDTKRVWNTLTDRGWVLLEMSQKVLLSALALRNVSCSSVDVEIAMENKRHGFIKVKSATLLPHNRRAIVRCGQLPCRFVRLTFQAPVEVCLASVEALGLATHQIKAAIGQSFKKILARVPEKIVFGPSLEASLEHKDFTALEGGYGSAVGQAGAWSECRSLPRWPLPALRLTLRVPASPLGGQEHSVIVHIRC